MSISLMKDDAQALSNQNESTGVNLTASLAPSNPRHQLIQTEINESKVISAFSLDKMILSFPKIDPQPYSLTQSTKRKKRNANISNILNHKTAAKASSSALELPEFLNRNRTQQNQTNELIVKEPKSFVINQRDYSRREKSSVSRLNLAELTMRSPGKGMYIKVGQYKSITKSLPFQLKTDELLPSNYTEASTELVQEARRIKAEKQKYDKRRVFEKDNEQMMRFRAKQRQLEEAKKKGLLNNYEQVARKKRDKGKESVKEKMRDKAMIALMMQFGEKQLMYKLISYQVAQTS